MNTSPRPHPPSRDEVPTKDPERAVSYADPADWVADYPPPPRPGPSTVTWWGLTRSLAIKVVTIVCVLGIAAFVVWKSVPTPAPVRIPEGFLSSAPPHSSVPAGNTAAPAGVEPPATAFVHVAGAVNDPGLVEMPEGARAADAIEGAGGPLEEADLGAINLAAPITDGEQIYLPTVDEEHSPAAQVSGEESGVVNINTADEAELQKLPGIGPVMAERIVTYREAHGPFSAVDDLQAVPGIGPVLMSQLRSGITV